MPQVNTNMVIVLVSGGFDPIHSGHIEYLKSAKKLGDRLIVGLNSDAWLCRKKGKPFMPVSERSAVIENLSCVDGVIPFNDQYDADGSCKKFIEDVLRLHPNDEIVFANGGDRTKTNIPEMDVESDRLSFVFGVGGENKMNSSSWILKEWKYPSETRVWGEFFELYSESGTKVKQLVVEPGCGISYQKHFLRDELWFVSHGNPTVKHSSGDPENYTTHHLSPGDTFFVRAGEWHQIINEEVEPVKIIEVQYGSECEEEDIERLSYYSN